MKNVPVNKMTLTDIAEATDLPTRQLRYVIDHELIPGLRLGQQERGNARNLHEAQKPVRIISWGFLLTLPSPMSAFTFSLSETSLHAH